MAQKTKNVKEAPFCQKKSKSLHPNIQYEGFYSIYEMLYTS
jgi:hypothetical protein